VCRKLAIGLLFMAGLTLAGCATAPTDPEDRADWEALNDPLEPTNRVIFDFNNLVDEYVLAPIARTYRAVLPGQAQLAIHNFLANLSSPWIFVNDVAQMNGLRAYQTAERFVVNSTIGVGGLFDVVASNNGPLHHDEDFGQTLAVWGVPEGPYLMLPFLGPSNPRDTTGLVTEYFADPTDIVLSDNDLDWAVWTRLGLGIVDLRTQLLDPLDDLKKSSLDYYSAIRSIYRQRRDSLISNKDVPVSKIVEQGPR
jgi:phospholipid-binding lipoprotein MlaA